MSAKAPIFGPDRQVAGDGRRRALVGVRRPVVERDGRNLERDAGHHEREAHRQSRRERHRSGRDSEERGCDAVDAGRAGQAPDEGEPEQEDRRAERAEEEVLDRALGRIAVGLVVRREHVARQDHELEAQEEQQQVGRGREQHRPGHREDEDDGELGDGEAARFQVVGGEDDRQAGDRHEQQVEERRQRVDPVCPAECVARSAARDESRGGHDCEAAERDADRDPRPAGQDEIDDQDRDGDADRGDERGDDREVARGHRVAPPASSGSRVSA